MIFHSLFPVYFLFDTVCKFLTFLVFLKLEKVEDYSEKHSPFVLCQVENSSGKLSLRQSKESYHTLAAVCLKYAVFYSIGRAHRFGFGQV